MTDGLKDLVRDATANRFPFDRLGLICLVWTVVFIVLTAALSLTLR